jgi:hypothetical protein
VIIFGFLPQNFMMMAVAVAFIMAWREPSLIGERGWTFDRAEQWLLRAARHDLLDGH